MNEADLKLIYESVRFAVWAAGEGICPQTDDADSPEDFLYDYAYATGDDDYDGYANKIMIAREDGRHGK